LFIKKLEIFTGLLTRQKLNNSINEAKNP